MKCSYDAVPRLLLSLRLLHATDLGRISQVLVTQAHSHSLPAVNCLLNRLFVGDQTYVGVVLYLELPLEVFGAEELGIQIYISTLPHPGECAIPRMKTYRQDDDVGVNATHKYTDYLAVVIPRRALARLRVDQRSKREPLADSGLDRGRCRADQVAELIRRANDEGPEGTGRQLHQVDRDNTPRALYAELLKEGGSDDSLRGHERVRVQKRAPYYADDDDTEAPAEGLRKISHNSATAHGAEVGHDLCDGHGVGVKFELILEHGGIETNIKSAVETQQTNGQEMLTPGYRGS